MKALSAVAGVVLAAAAFAAEPPINPREYSHRIWRVEDGLPQNRIQALTQTADGYLWIGTSEGLARFDGVRFYVYNRANVAALRDDSILALTPSRDGTLWIGTEGGGLLHYDPRSGTFQEFGDSAGLTNGFIRAIYEDVDGVLWVGADRGLFRMKGERFERLDGTAEIPLASVVSILADRNRKLWVAGSRGLLTMDGGQLKVVNCGSGVLTSRYALHESADGIFRVINQSGASVLRDGCPVPDPSIPHVGISLLHEDRAGNLWAGTAGNGLFRLRDGKLTRFNAPAVLPHNHVTTFLEDRQNNLWIGASDGLLRLSRTAVTTIGLSEGIADDNVATVYEDRRNRLWIATLTGQLYRLNHGKPERFSLPNTDFAARLVFQDSKGNYWFASNNRGIARVIEGRTVIYGPEAGLRSRNIRQIFEDSRGMIWVATGSGLSWWDGSKFHTYYLEDGLSYPSLRCIAETAGGDLLIGTDGGLNRMRNGHFVHEPADQEIGKEKIWSIHVDASGGIWLGTRGAGLIRIKAGKVSRLQVRDGLPANSIYRILEDRSSKIWLSSPTGIFAVDRNELDHLADGHAGEFHVVTYGSADGMETSQMSGGSQPAGILTQAGEIWFPSLRGAVQVHPDKQLKAEVMPVVIERAMAGDVLLPPGRPISIPSGTGRLAIEFTTCNLTAPQQQLFRYKLEPFDESWSPASRSRTAIYTNVPPGKYKFRVHATSAGAPSQVGEASIALTQLPAFHQTMWFYSLCLLAAGGLVWVAFWMHTRQTASRYALLLAERTRLAREMHDTVIQGCVGVSTLLEASSRFQRSNLDEANQLLDQARDEVKTTIEGARQAVWNLRHASENQSSIPMLFEIARKFSRQNSVLIEMQTTGERVQLDPAIDRTLMLVGSEALRNAVAHGKASRVTIELLFGSAGVKLEVRDDGAGFDQSQAQPEGHFGITGMRERIEQVGGKFALRSAVGAGTLVTASVPLKPQRSTPAAYDLQFDDPPI